MTSPVQQARVVFGARLREFRKDAGLTGRDLARAAGWAESKVSRFERARRAPSEADLRQWCRLTGSLPQLPDLLAGLRAIQDQWDEHRALVRARINRGQVAWGELEEAATQTLWYEQWVIPGLLQTAAYARAVLTLAANELQISDIESTIRTRLNRQHVLYAVGKTWAFLIEEQALMTVVGPGVLAGQIDRLLALKSLPNVSLGIIPARAERGVLPEHSFAVFDRAVMVETVTADLPFTEPHEINAYRRKFDLLSQQARYGGFARRILTDAANHA
ncbi:helix-turn-helix domain-containing protein [Actinomadura rupiterrae]|uniref:helix-turn-helix domain-containing protein n=1 Tax=Actinomadura rupiterrae TaxID=559627 RepID=UPI0020A26178|nr:helix-turn-helix transcriptional regulator [Actinomadura rupiterrae]MCP2343561.1 transcriptional regulator with XRE-family HTH domain [Actinomadura rupiterrae]